MTRMGSSSVYPESQWLNWNTGDSDDFVLPRGFHSEHSEMRTDSLAGLAQFRNFQKTLSTSDRLAVGPDLCTLIHDQWSETEQSTKENHEKWEQLTTSEVLLGKVPFKFGCRKDVPLWLSMSLGSSADSIGHWLIFSHETFPSFEHCAGGWETLQTSHGNTFPFIDAS
jgi:hypothetical protein